MRLCGNMSHKYRSYMFRSSNIIRELVLNLAEVTFMLKHSVKLRRYYCAVVWQHVMEWRVCCMLCTMHIIQRTRQNLSRPGIIDARARYRAATRRMRNTGPYKSLCRVQNTKGKLYVCYTVSSFYYYLCWNLHSYAVKYVRILYMMNRKLLGTTNVYKQFIWK
jgi:hypothetical protein